MTLQGHEEIVLVKPLHLLGGIHRSPWGRNKRVEVSIQWNEEFRGARGKVASEGEGWLSF